jgi:hypothetical protein
MIGTNFLRSILILFFISGLTAQGNRVGDFHLKDGRTIKGSFGEKLLIVKSDSDEKGTSYWIVSSNSLTSIARASLDQPKPQQAARFIIKNDPSRLIFAKISTAMLQTQGAESAILTKLSSDFDNPPPTEGVYLSFVTIAGKQQMVPANSFRGALKETATFEFLDSSIKLRDADGKTITIPVTQLVSYTRQPA